MATMVAGIHCFKSSDAAQAFFDNSIKESEGLDGFWLKREGYFRVMEGEDQFKSYLDETQAIYIVIAYPKGTGFAIDSGAVVNPPAAEGPDPAQAEEPE